MSDKKDEALKLALEALESLFSGKVDEHRAQRCSDAITAIREALAEQPAQPAQPAQQRPQNCGTGYCSCIECLFEQPAQQQEPVAGWEAIEAMAAERYKVVPSHDSMFYRHAVVAGNGTQQLYLGRELECENMARKFAGAFLDGAFVMQSRTSPPASKPLPEDYTAMEQALTRLQKRYAELEGKASKPWVGLTEQERNDLEDYCEMIIGRAAFEAIEAKLWEKNA